MVEHPSRILLATDGKSHSRRAEEWAFSMTGAFDTSLTVLHVMDNYLKQFYNEIYAQGRREYLEHVDHELAEAAGKIARDIGSRVRHAGLSCCFKERCGDPLEEIIAELSSGDYDLLVVGGKRLSGMTAFRSWNLPARLAGKIGTVSIMVVRSN